MIAVSADVAEHSLISEFFELFKTPWQFYQSSAPCDVLICSGTQFPNSSARLVLIYGGEQNSFDRENGIEILSQRSKRVLSYGGDRIPVYGNCLTFKDAGVRLLADEETQESVALEIASPEQTLVRIGFDLFQEIRYLLALGQPIVYARIPTLELHIALLRHLIVSHSIPLVEIPPVPHGYNFITCLTHDVDHPGIRNHQFDHTMFGFLYRATIGSFINFCRRRKSVRQLAANWMAAFSLPFVHLGLARDFWERFDRYVDIEGDFASTFFVIPKKGDPGHGVNGSAPSKRAARYDITDIGLQIERLIAARREIGCHGIDGWRDAAEGRRELECIRGMTGTAEIGTRSHWLFSDQQSAAKLEEAGFSYDSTAGYNETVGYRAGTSQVFKPQNLERMLELPMHIMDTALFYPAHMNLSPKQARRVTADLIGNASRFGGVLTVNWHDRSIAPERLWDGTYRQLLDDLRNKNAWFPTAAHAVSWFRKRRSARIDGVTRDGDAVRVRVSLTPRSDKLPGLRLRAHRSQAHPNSGLGQREYQADYVDMEFNESCEIELPSGF